MADGSREHEATEEQRACAEVLSVSVGTSECGGSDFPP